jgi:surface antigen
MVISAFLLSPVAIRPPPVVEGHSVRIVASFTNARGEVCRVVEQSVLITGERALATGTMCQQADGSWTLIDGRSSSGAAGFSGSTVPPP